MNGTLTCSKPQTTARQLTIFSLVPWFPRGPLFAFALRYSQTGARNGSFRHKDYVTSVDLSGA